MHRFSAVIFGVALLALSASLVYGQFEKQRYDPASVSSLVDQVHSDLNHAYRDWHLSNGDRDRLNHAEKELREFAQKWSNHNFDKGELDDVIGSIQHVLDNNKMSGRERDAVSDDVTQLRNMREAYDRHEIG